MPFHNKHLVGELTAEQSYVGGLYLDQGLEAVRSWLCPLLLPYALKSYRAIRHEYGLPPDDCETSAKTSTPHAQHSTNATTEESRPKWASPPPARYSGASVGHLALFNQCLQQVSKSAEWVYTDSAGEGSRTTPVWVSDGCVWIFVAQANTLLVGRSSHGRWKLHWSWTGEHEESRKERGRERRANQARCSRRTSFVQLPSCVTVAN